MKKPLLRRVANRILGHLARHLPGSESLRPALHRLRGVKIGRNVFIGDDVYLENEYPEAVVLEDGAQLCLRSIVLAHTNGLGAVSIGKNAFVGANSVISAPKGKTLRIGAGAVVSASCVVTTNVPDGALIGNPNPKILARATIPLGNNTRYEDFLLGLRAWKG